MTTPLVRSVYKVDVSDIFQYRKEKHCVCVSVGWKRYLVINTKHYDMYDDFEIDASDYPFLKGRNRFVACRKLVERDSSKIKEEVGILSIADTVTAMKMIEKSDVISMVEKATVLAELSKALVEARLAD